MPASGAIPGAAAAIPGAAAAAGAPVVEVEAKVAVPSPDPVRQALRRLGAAASPAAVEEDAFFRHPARDLTAADEALRLRRVAEGGFELTYKGPRAAGPFKSREERTVRMADDPTALLGALGFEVAARLRKTRERHRLAAVEVTLDHLDGLGWFVEVEALGATGAAAEGAVRAALRELGLDGEPLVRESYLELALAAGVAARE